MKASSGQSIDRWNLGSHGWGSGPLGYTVRRRWAHPISAFISLSALLAALCTLYKTKLPKNLFSSVLIFLDTFQKQPIIKAWREEGKMIG